jgi:hypothetical protein
MHSPVPKEQPPRKLSGHRTGPDHNTLERGALAPAEGITISGKRTEGASQRGQSAARLPMPEPPKQVRPEMGLRYVGTAPYCTL